jgi:hypothetical protein
MSVESKKRRAAKREADRLGLAAVERVIPASKANTEGLHFQKSMGMVPPQSVSETTSDTGELQ